jgi:hypothetical protein
LAQHWEWMVGFHRLQLEREWEVRAILESFSRDQCRTADGQTGALLLAWQKAGLESIQRLHMHTLARNFPAKISWNRPSIGWRVGRNMPACMLARNLFPAAGPNHLLDGEYDKLIAND